MSTPLGYEKKFAGFIKLCSDSKANGLKQVMVAYPWVLGDNYEELIESLARLADAELGLQIGGPERLAEDELVSRVLNQLFTVFCSDTND